MPELLLIVIYLYIKYLSFKYLHFIAPSFNSYVVVGVVVVVYTSTALLSLFTS